MTSDKEKKTTSGLLLTLNRGLEMLEQIAREEGRATAKSLSSDLDVNLGTCYQLLRTLQANGYVHRLPGSRYGLGARVSFLAEYYNHLSSPPPELAEILHDLRDEIQETTYVSIRRGRDIGIVDALEGTRMLRVGNLAVGYTGHPHIRASAKAFLAYTPEDQIEDFFDTKDFEVLTPNTIKTWDDFLVELEATRKRGYGIDNEEYTLGVSCIGAVIVDEDGAPYGAYGTSFSVSRLAPDEHWIAERVRAAAERASRSMGYEGPYPPPSPKA